MEAMARRVGLSVGACVCGVCGSTGLHGRLPETIHVRRVGFSAIAKPDVIAAEIVDDWA